MRDFRLIIVSGVVMVIFMAGVMLLFAEERRELAPSGPAVNTSDSPPDTFQEAVSIHEERREVTDFLVAPPELIQQILNGKKILTYDQN